MMTLLYFCIILLKINLIYFDICFAFTLPQAVGEGLEERRAALAHMESDCEALLRFLTPGEADHIWAKLTDMKLCWEKLKFKIEQLERQLNVSPWYRDRDDAFEQVYISPYLIG